MNGQSTAHTVGRRPELFGMITAPVAAAASPPASLLTMTMTMTMTMVALWNTLSR